jgi:predicted nucleotidyltransferase
MLRKRYLNGVEILSIDKDRLISKLKKISSRIRSDHPGVTEIKLFGSFSRDDFTPYSDADIAIIVNSTDKPFITRQDEYIDYFLDIPVDTNLLIYTSDELKRMLRDGNNLLRDITNGITL